MHEEALPWALWSAGVVQKQIGTSYTIIVMYLPGTWARLISGFETTLGHSKHFCTVFIQADVKSEIKTSRLGSAF